MSNAQKGKDLVNKLVNKYRDILIQCYEALEEDVDQDRRDSLREVLRDFIESD